MILIPRWIDVERVTFKYGLGDEFINVLKTLQKLDLRLDRLRSRCAASRCRPATSWPPPCPTRPSSATRCTAAPAPARG